LQNIHQIIKVRHAQHTVTIHIHSSHEKTECLQPASHEQHLQNNWDITVFNTFSKHLPQHAMPTQMRTYFGTEKQNVC